MKKLLFLLLFIPAFATAQINGTIQKTASSGTVRGSFGSAGVDTLPRSTGVLLNGVPLIYNSATNKYTTTKVGASGIDTTAIRTVANSRSLAQTQTALDLKANLASPTFTGTVTIPSGSSLGTPTTLVGTNITGTALALSIGGSATLWNGYTLDMISGAPSVPISSGPLVYNDTDGEFRPSTAAQVATFISGQTFNTLGSAATLTNTRTIWGQNFNGSANVSGALTGVTGITTSGGYTQSGSTANTLTGALTGTSGTFNGGVATTAGSALSAVSSSGTVTNILQSDNTAGYLGTNTNHPLYLRTNSTTRYTIDASGNTITGTGTPTSYGAGWVTSAFNASTGSSLNLMAGGSDRGTISATASAVDIVTIGAIPLRTYTNSTLRHTLDASGNNTWTGNGAFTGTVSASNLTSGTYAPTFTGILNITSATAPDHQYTRVGNEVTVYGRVSITPTAFANTSSEIEFTLPVASNMTLVDDLFGIVQDSPSYTNYNLNADVTNDRAQISFNAQASSISIVYSFRYIIK